ncbi:MAG TPA: polysaccharide biosynthesis/export family protein [Pyrinomonadaceae bacterium]|jgi:polysaccharide export outer membrane protein|nr:polysaccharide biosynthesis/export family protein [Pyrinomonadaceae bacterium]
MKRSFMLMAVAVGMFFPGLARTQEPQSSQGQDVPQRPTSQESAVDNQGIRNYLLGPGDVLDVRVFGQSDLNAIVEVDSDGNISSLPFLDSPISAKCRTDKDIQKDIAKAYAKYLKNPQVSVRISERKSRQPATVFGAVRQPTRVQMQRKIRLNELVVVSGGFTDRASGTIQILHTEPLMCPQPGEEALAAPIDGTKVPFEIVKISELRSGKAQANPVIRPGDYVMVTEAEPVYITGSVMAPQGIFLRDQLTLSRALAMVGGARPEARLNDVRIYRQKPGATDQEMIRVDYAAIKKNQKPDFFLQAFDVIEVPEAGMFSPGRLGKTLVGAVSGSLGSMFTTGGTSIANRVIY